MSLLDKAKSNARIILGLMVAVLAVYVYLTPSDWNIYSGVKTQWIAYAALAIITAFVYSAKKATSQPIITESTYQTTNYPQEQTAQSGQQYQQSAQNWPPTNQPAWNPPQQPINQPTNIPSQTPPTIIEDKPITLREKIMQRRKQT